MPWLIRCFQIAQGRAVFHGFTLTSWKVMKSFPWYSVDSSSWGQGFRYGQVPVFSSKRGEFVKLPLGDVEKWKQHAGLVRQLGFDWKDFAYRDNNDRAKICAISALSYMMAEQWLRKRHGLITIPGANNAPGVRAHLADANPARFGEAVKGGGVHLHLADTSNGINYSDADKGLKLHLADARPGTASDLAAANTGMKVHLAEPSLDRGGLGDTSRAMEILT